MSRLVCWTIAALIAGGAGAAAANDTMLLPDRGAAEALKCLTPPPGSREIAYPKEVLERKSSGYVRVSLRFDDAVSEPRVTVLFSGAEELADAVRRHVKAYRLPCLQPGSAPVSATQEFHFDPRDGRPVAWHGEAYANQIPGTCVVHAIDPPKIRYPAAALRKNESGTLMFELRFDAPGPPAEVRLLNEVSSRKLESVARDHMAKLRLACKDSGGEWPKRVVQTFRFRIEGNEGFVLKDLSLRQLVAAMEKREPPQRELFDLNSLSCPFEVDLVLRQPYAPNSVGQVGAVDPNRGSFLSWLGTVRLRIPPETLTQVLGDTIRVSVPCGRLDITS